MADRCRPVSIEELPSHLIFEILSSGRLSAVDLVSLELTSRTFGGSHGLYYPQKFRSLVDFAAFQMCVSHLIYVLLGSNAQRELCDRCGGNWKRVLQFLQSVEQSSDIVETSAGNMQITTGKYHTFLISNASVYSSGSGLCGVLGHGSETTQCVMFTRLRFPSLANVIQVSASHNHAAFIMQSGENKSSKFGKYEIVMTSFGHGEQGFGDAVNVLIVCGLSRKVFTCGDNSSSCCGHKDTSRPIVRPRLVEALNGIPCMQVSTGLNFTVFLTRQGHVYTCGINTHGQLGHGDTADRPTPKIVEMPEGVGSIVQVASGPSYVLAVAADGTVFSFGYGANFCLGHGEQHSENRPRPILAFKRKGIHVIRVSAGDEHVVALDSSGYVYTWGKGYCGALGHGDEIDKTRPELLNCLKSDIAVQVCARKRKTFVLADSGLVYGFGWMGFGSLGFPDKGASDKVLNPRIVDCLRPHRVSQISTGLYHTLALTNRGRIFGFGDNERAQLGHDNLRGCLKPTEIDLQKTAFEIGSSSN